MKPFSILDLFYLPALGSKQIKYLFKNGLRVGHSAIPEAQGTLTMPVLGHRDWEEKRHQLLLQKMQLEVERERLQVRLAEQEVRLGRQNQPLQQSRLHSSRCPGKNGELSPPVVPLNAYISTLFLFLLGINKLIWAGHALLMEVCRGTLPFNTSCPQGT